MKYDFDRVFDRRNTGSVKYDSARARGLPEGVLPLWVADMDFQAPAEVLADLRKTVEQGFLGYTVPTDDYYESVSGWFRERFGYTVTREAILPFPGVVFALAQIVRAFTNEGDGIIVQTPVYYPFYRVIRDNGRRVAANPLVYRDGRYTMDFDGFERLAAQKEVTMFLLCSPHNPVGRVWTKEELSRLQDICKRNGVLVVSDEIHCDFVYPGHVHVNFGLLDQDAILCTAPSKTFNLAGLQTANIFIVNKDLRQRLLQESQKNGYHNPNALGLAACKSAYQLGGPWLAALKIYLRQNLQLIRTFLQERLPKIKLVEPEGTYLVWLDFSAYGLSQSALDHRIIEGARLWLDSGTLFGPEGHGFQRVNIACPRSVLAGALEQLENEFNE